jgi:predicted alpha/beta hydrolase
VSTYRVRAADGWTLGVRETPASGDRRGAILLLHAMMVDARSLDRPVGGGLASTLAAGGFDVHAADLRGRGESGPGAGAGARWSYDDIALRDVPALVDGVRDRCEGPLYVVGHSLGGHAALAAAGVGAHTIAPDGHVLLASNLWMPSLEGSRRRRLAKGLAIAGFRSVTEAFGRFPSRALRVGPVDEAAAYVDDLCRTWEVDRWEGAGGEHDYLASMSYVTGPVLAVVGAGDRLLAHSEGARAFVEHLGPGRAEFWRVGAGDHGLSFTPGHMGIVTDQRCRPLWRAIGGWVGARIDEAKI